MWMATLLNATALSTAPLGNLSPSDALKTFETEPGFTVTHVAAEPRTIGPVAIAFDERGRWFVAEGRDYAAGSPDSRPFGVTALLEDTEVPTGEFAALHEWQRGGGRRYAIAVPGASWVKSPRPLRRDWRPAIQSP